MKAAVKENFVFPEPASSKFSRRKKRTPAVFGDCATGGPSPGRVSRSLDASWTSRFGSRSPFRSNRAQIASPLVGKESSLTSCDGRAASSWASEIRVTSEQSLKPQKERRPAYDPNGKVQSCSLSCDKQFWEIFKDVRTLGRGHFAKVKEVRHRESEETFAVKILDKEMTDNRIESMVREFKMLCTLRHPNIVRLYAAYETPKHLYLVTELATGGELMKRLGETKKVYSEAVVRSYVRTLLDAVDYMHKMNCVHRDLKPENVLVSNMSEDATVKIVDLGLSRVFDERKLMQTVCGTHSYLAPELVQTDRGVVEGYGKAIDMWGVGMLTFVMLFGFNPFERETQQETHDAIVECELYFPVGYTVSIEAKMFVLALLRRDPAKRLAAEQALAHPWIINETAADAAPLLNNEKKPVKNVLSEFNAQRMMANLVKGAHRRLSINSPAQSPAGTRSPSRSASPNI